MLKWYILQAASGSEKKVQKMIEDQILKQGMSEYFEEIKIPTVDVPEVKRGRKVLSEKKLMPGYIFIKMHMTDESWHLVKSVPKTSGFLGGGAKPAALKDADARSIFDNLEHESQNVMSDSLHMVGDKVQIIDGPFDGFLGIVQELDIEVQKLKVSVSIFGKATPIELSLAQVKKNL